MVALLCVLKYRRACGDRSLARVSCPEERAGCTGGGPEWHCQPGGLIGLGHAA